jgi:hypothetical protein
MQGEVALAALVRLVEVLVWYGLRTRVPYQAIHDARSLDPFYLEFCRQAWAVLVDQETLPVDVLPRLYDLDVHNRFEVLDHRIGHVCLQGSWDVPIVGFVTVVSLVLMVRHVMLCQQESIVLVYFCRPVAGAQMTDALADQVLLLTWRHPFPAVME